MKVLHVCESIVGGIATYINELLPHQIVLYGHENVGLITPKEQNNHLENFKIPVWTFNKINRTNPLSHFSMLNAYVRAINDFSPDIVHAHSSFAGLLIRLYALYLGKERNFRIIYCSHGWAFDRDTSNLSKWLTAFIEKRLSVLTDKIVCISEHDQQSALRVGIPQKKLVVVKNTINPFDSKNIKFINGIDTAKRNFLFVGRFDKQKGFDLIAEAVRHSKSKDFCIYCIGDSVIGQTSNFPDDKRMIWLGWQNKTIVANYMYSCDALLVPSRWEGFGLVALESIVIGCPVFHSGVGGLKEISPESSYYYLLKSPILESIIKLLNVTTKRDLQTSKKILKETYQFDYSMSDLCLLMDKIYREKKCI